MKKKSVMRMGYRHLSTEKGPPSDFDRGIYKNYYLLLKGKFSEVKRGIYRI